MSDKRKKKLLFVVLSRSLLDNKRGSTKEREQRIGWIHYETFNSKKKIGKGRGRIWGRFKTDRGRSWYGEIIHRMVEESQETKIDFIRSQIEDAEIYNLGIVGKNVGKARQNFRRGTGETSVGSIKVRIVMEFETLRISLNLYSVSIRYLKKCKNIV